MYGQFWTTVYTPLGTGTPDKTCYIAFEEYSSSEKAAIKADYMKRFPNAIYRDEATSTYNCHAYAWHISVGGERVWLNKDSSGCPSTYWKDGSYVETNESDPAATRVSYPNGDHSAIISTPSTYFVSKWGAVCLFKHRKDDCPYNSKGLRYYKLSMTITGQKILRIPDGSESIIADYYLTNVPNGISVTWDIPYTTIISGQGTNHVQVALSSYRTISATIRSGAGNTTNIPSIEVKASKSPIITDIEMFQYGQYNGDYTLCVVTNQPLATYTWRVSDAQLGKIPYPDDASFIVYPNLYKSVTFPKNGYYTVTVYGQNGNNISNTFSKEFYISTAGGSL